MAVIESKGNGYALYNNVALPDLSVSLPELPESAPDKLTKILILTNKEYEEFLILLSQEPLYSDGGLICSGDFYVAICNYLAQESGFDEWQIVGENIGDNLDIWLDYNTPVFANYDFIEITDNSVLLPTSEDPIPLDGMNVIEWDGDMTGVWDNGDYTYILAPYARASNAIAVIGGKVYTHFEGGREAWIVCDSDEYNYLIAYANVDMGICACVIYDDEGNPHYTSLIAYTPVEKTTVDYTISYRTAHGTAPNAKTVTVDYGESYTLTEADLPAITAEGYVFNGWAINGKGMAKAGDTISADAVLYASWNEATEDYVISYSTEHGTKPANKTVTVDYGESYALTAADLPTLSAEGYIFGGWLLDGVPVNVGDTINDNSTLVAVWSENIVSTFNKAWAMLGYVIGTRLRDMK